MKPSKLLIGGGLALLLAACGSNETQPNAPVALAPAGDNCQFDNGNSGAPLWICDFPVEGYPVTAVGRYAKSGAGMGYMRKQAALEARSAMAESMRSKIKSKTDAFAGTTGSGDSETVDKVGNAMAEALSSETLVGTSIIRSQVGPDGEIYLLLAMDENATATTIQNAVNTSMNNEKAAWQQFRKTDEFKKFKDDIDKEFGSQIQ